MAAGKKTGKKRGPAKGKGKSIVPPERLRFVEQALRAQVGAHEITQQVAEKFDVSLRTGYNDIKRIYKRWEAEEDEFRPMRRQQFRRTLELIMHKALAAKNYEVARKCAIDIARAHGVLEADVVVEHRGRVKLEAMTSAERRNRIEELIEERKRIVDATDVVCEEKIH